MQEDILSKKTFIFDIDTVKAREILGPSYTKIYKMLEDLISNKNQTTLELEKNINSKDFSHQNLLLSIQYNWAKHLKTLNNKSESFSPKNGVFFIYFMDNFLKMSLNPSEGQYSSSDIIEYLNKVKGPYKIKYDGELLNWIYENKSFIRYVFFISENKLFPPEYTCSIIDIDYIPFLIDKIKYPIDFHTSTYIGDRTFGYKV